MSLRRLVLASASLLIATSALAAEPDAAAIHARALVLDSHVDVPPTFDAAIDGDGQVDLPKLERGQVDAAVLAVFVSQGPRTPEGYAKAKADADAKLAVIRALAKRHPDRAVLALSAKGVEAAAKAGKRAIVVGFLNAYPFGESLEPIDAYYRAGVRSIDYAVKRIGVDHVGIASDFNHGGGVVGWANESEAANVTAELLRHGYSEADIDRLWGGNWLRVFRQVEAVRR